MRILVGHGGELILPFGSALTGIIANDIEISWAEFDKYVTRYGERRLVNYIAIVRCRILDGGEFRIL